MSRDEDSLGRGSDIKGAEAKNLYYWVEGHKGENIIWRLPQNVRWNDNMMVREDEFGVFFRDGKALQVFDRPDRYALTSQNIPILGTLGKAILGLTQIGEFFWVQKREFRSKFGSSEPLTFRDNDFGIVRIRAFGQFSYKVTDPLLFITQFVGTKGITSSEEILGWLKDQVIMVLNDTLGELKTSKKLSILDMPAHLQDIEQICLSKLNSETGPYGLKILKFVGLNLNLPEEVQAAVDKRGAMAALGVNYMQYQTGKAIEGIGIGAQKGGEATGFATLGAGLGAGYVFGSEMSKGIQREITGAQQENEEIRTCPACHEKISLNAKFCPGCGKPVRSPGTEERFCRKCNQSIGPDMKFCPHCGAALTVKCPKCQTNIPSGTKFCPNCGEKIV